MDRSYATLLPPPLDFEPPERPESPERFDPDFDSPLELDVAPPESELEAGVESDELLLAESLEVLESELVDDESLPDSEDLAESPFAPTFAPFDFAARLSVL